MTAISSTGFRDTVRMGPEVVPQRLSLPVTATKNARQGGIAVVTAGTGTAQPANTALGLIAVGVFQKAADNTASLSPAPLADIEGGVFFMNNSGGVDLIAAANFGQLCYLVDDQTVALTDAAETRSPAGIILGVSTDPATNGMIAVAIGVQNLGVALAISSGGASPQRIQSGSVTLVAGVGVVNTGIELTATSKIVLGRTAKGAGDMGVKEVAVITTPGIPGTAVLTITAQSVAGVTTATDVGTISYLIID